MKLRGALRTALLLAIVAVSLTACTQTTPTARNSATPNASPLRPAPVPSATPTPTATPAAATCENIMAPDFSSSWTPVEIEGKPAFADGITCRWQADHSVGTDNMLAYAWGPATAEDWTALTEEYLGPDSAWFVEEGDRGSYLTSKTDYWVRDEEDYGSTYLFTGEHLIYAMTKAETDDVVGPPMEMPSLESQP